MSLPEPAFTSDDLDALLQQQFAQYRDAVPVKVEAFRKGFLRLRYHIDQGALRPGGSVSGPTQMTAADIASYMIVQGHIGEKAMALTSDLHIRFLNRPKPVDLIVEAQLIKLGRRLAVAECTLSSDGDDVIVAKASVTYMIPQS